jgi:RNA polymerase sigma factor (TIGR02999 family)
MEERPHPGGSPGPDNASGTPAELLPQVYEELRRLARSHVAREREGLTLQPTALVHEAYLRLTKDGAERRWDRPGHFFAAAAIAMRRILVERARRYHRIRHGGREQRVDLDDSAPGPDPDLTDVLAIDQALTRLEELDPRKARIVLLRYFAGLTIEETAEAIDVSAATVKSEWAFARAWLHDQLGSHGSTEDEKR